MQALKQAQIAHIPGILKADITLLILNLFKHEIMMCKYRM